MMWSAPLLNGTLRCLKGERAFWIRDDDDLRNDRTLYEILIRSGVLDGSFDYIAFNELIEKILYTDFVNFEYERFLEGIKSVMI